MPRPLTEPSPGSAAASTSACATSCAAPGAASWRPAASLATPRLTLRPPEPRDAAAIFAYGSDAEVTRYLSWSTHRSLDDAQRFVTDAGRKWTLGTDFAYVAQRRDDGQVVGGIGATPVEGGLARIGYVLARPAWGQGLGAEMVGAFTNALLALPGVTGVEALVHPDNTASMRVLERHGFVSVSFGPRCGALPNLGTTPDVHTFLKRRSPGRAPAAGKL